MSGHNGKLAAEVASSPAFAGHLKRMRDALQHTLQEPGLKASFSDGCVERVESVIGAVIRTDRRLLEDLRAAYESGTCELMLLGEVVDAVVTGIL